MMPKFAGGWKQNEKVKLCALAPVRGADGRNGDQNDERYL